MLLGIFDGMLGGTVIMLVLMFLYLLPTLIAAARHTQIELRFLTSTFS